IEQTSKVEGSVTTSGATLGVDGTQQAPSGATSSASQTDNDPNTNTTTQPSCPVSQASSTPLQQFDPGGSGNGITLTPGSTDTGCTVSAVAASSSSSPACNDTLGTPQNTALPCGSGSVQQSGTTESAGLTLSLAGVSLGTPSLATVAAAPNAGKT